MNRRRPSSPATLPSLARIFLPVLLLLAVLCLWESVVQFGAIPTYVLPAPTAIGTALIADWPLLWQALLATMATTLAGLALALVSGVGLAILFARSRALELVLHPYAVIFQVTPVIAIAPLLLIYTSPATTVLVCAWIIAFFPILASTTTGLRVTDRNLLGLFQLCRASRWQTLLHLRLPAALPDLLAGLRIGGSLSLIGAVVAEIAAGTAGAGKGLAFRIVEAEYQLNLPRMFAALLLLALLGVAIFAGLSVLSHLMLRRWYDEANTRVG